MEIKPLISVIIPTCHRNDLLAQCLDCLAPRTQTLPANEYEVIVTDDGREMTAEQMICENYSWARWVPGPHNGPAANRNNGVQYAQGDWLAFTDDDCLPDCNWLAAFKDAMNSSSLALEGAIHPIGDLNQDLAECPVNLTGGNFWSANIAVKASLFTEVKGFDHSYPLAAHEDQDLKIRVSSLTQIKFVELALVFHPVRKLSLRDRIFKMPSRCKAWAWHASKHRNEYNFVTIRIFALSQYRFHLTHLKSQLLRLHYYNVISSLVMLSFGVPLNIYYFWRANSHRYRPKTHS